MSDLFQLTMIDLRAMQAALELQADGELRAAMTRMLEGHGEVAAFLFDPALTRSAIMLWDLKRTNFSRLRLVAVPRGRSRIGADAPWREEADAIIERSILRAERLEDAARPVRRIAMIQAEEDAERTATIRHAMEAMFGAVDCVIFAARPLLAHRPEDLPALGGTFDLIVYLVAGDGAEIDFLAAAAHWPGLLIDLRRTGDDRITHALSRLCWATVTTLDGLSEVLPEVVARTQARATLHDEVAAAILRHRPCMASLISVAEQIALTRTFGRARILYDVTEIGRRDAGTGIQRVAREILRHLPVQVSRDVLIEPVRLLARREGSGMESRRDYHDRLHGLPPREIDNNAAIEPVAGDIILGVDVNLRGIVDAEEAGLLSRWKARGVRLVVVVHDLLPLEMPDHFPDDLPPLFSKWLDVVAAQADLILFTSRVGRDLFLKSRIAVQCGENLKNIGYFPLGADRRLDTGTNISERVSDFIGKLGDDVQMILAVGSVEPRKGYVEVLNAFTSLWTSREASEERTCLVIIGQEGWKAGAIAAAIRDHEQFGEMLFWFDQATDADVEALISRANGLLMASHGEGFGLPIIEALVRDVPVLARRLPVFEEIAGSRIAYFEAQGAQALETILPRWLAELRDGAIAPANKPAIHDWSESCARLIEQMRLAKMVEPAVPRA